MRPAIRWCVVGLVFMSAGVARGQTALAWKLEPGESFRAERVTGQEQTVEVNGKTFRQSAAGTWVVAVDVLRRESAGYAVRLTLERVQHRVTGTVGKDGFDHKMIERLQGRQFPATVAPHGKVVALGGYPDLVKSLGDDQPERVKALRTALPEAALREAFADLFGPLPEKAVRPGDTWRRTVTDPVPHFGALKSTWNFTDEGPGRDGHRIAYAVTTAYRPPEEESPVFRVVKGELKGENGRGAVFWFTLPPAGR